MVITGIRLAIVIVVLMLILAVFILFTFAVVLRVQLNRRQRELLLKRSVWETYILDVLTGTGSSGQQSHLTIDREDWIIFAEYIEQYLLDIRGEDYDSITDFLKRTNIQEHLLESLSSRKTWERAYAAQFLGLMKCRKAVPYLDRLIGDPVQMVSITALEALSRIGVTDNISNNIRSVLENAHLTEKKIADVLFAYGAEIDSVLLKLLPDPELNDDARRIIIDVLTYRNVSESLPLVIDIGMKTANTELIVGCVKAVGAFGDSTSVEFLENHITSKEWVVRSQAVRAMGAVGSPLILPELLLRLKTDRNYWVRLYSAEAIARFGDRGVEMLKKVFDTTTNAETHSIIGYILES